MNIDACRVEPSPQDCPGEGRAHKRNFAASEQGCWPANLLLSHGRTCTSSRCERDCPIELLGERHRFLRREGPPPRARGRLRAAAQARRPDVQDRREE
jgi:hypothetical protein